MLLSRVWAMPNKNTFDIKPIKEIILKYKHGISVDPFANGNKLADITNDLDPQFDTDHNLDALDFLRLFETGSIDTVLFDPPYSPRQVSEVYKKFGKTVNSLTTSSAFWSKLKAEVSRIISKEGIVISCGWNSGGIGVKYGFSIVEVLLILMAGGIMIL